MSYENSWLYNNNPFESDHICGNYGYVYCITNTLTGKKYIGRKYFWSVTKQKGKTRRVKKESDWKNYYGSCKLLLEEMSKQGKNSYKREILSLHLTKGQVNYNEIKLQFKLDVLEALDENNKRMYYNDNIMSRYFSKKELGSLAL